MTLDYIKQYYKGFDINIIEALFEQGFVYSYTDPKSEGNLRIWYIVNYHQNLFDWCEFNKDLDFWKEFDWIDDDTKKGFLSYLGKTQESFDKIPLEEKIHNAINYFGYENICGTSTDCTKINPE